MADNMTPGDRAVQLLRDIPWNTLEDGLGGQAALMIAQAITDAERVARAAGFAQAQQAATAALKVYRAKREYCYDYDDMDVIDACLDILADLAPAPAQPDTADASGGGEAGASEGANNEP